MNKQQFLAKFEPQNLIVNLKIDSIEQVFEKNYLSLAMIRKDFSLNFSKKYIILWLAMIDNFHKAERTDIEYNILACMIYNEYWYFTVADLNLLFKKALKTKVYGQLTAAIIMQIFENYEKERNNIAEQINYIEQIQEKRISEERNLKQLISHE